MEVGTPHYMPRRGRGGCRNGHIPRCDPKCFYAKSSFITFSIWHPEADLWLLDLKTGLQRPLDEVNSPCADSQHSWSNNNRWFLFTSRRDDGLYTRIYFSMMGSDRRATKPFLLPQRNPKQFYRMLLYSYNTPDFTLQPVKTDKIGVEMFRK